MQNLLDVVNSLYGKVSEPARALVAQSMVNMITRQVKPADYKQWVEKGAPAFLAACKLSTPPSEAPAEITLEPTKLATLINKWSAMNKYKDGEHFRDFTQEMCGIRDAILEDLKYGCQLDTEGIVVLSLSDTDAERVKRALKAAGETDLVKVLEESQ